MQAPNFLSICSLTAAISIPSFLGTEYYLKDCSRDVANANPDVVRIKNIEYELSKLTIGKSAKEAIDLYLTDKEFATQYKDLKDEYQKIEEKPDVKIAQQQIQDNYVNTAFITLFLITGATLVPMFVLAALKRDKMIREEQPPAAEAVTTSDADY